MRCNLNLFEKDSWTWSPPTPNPNLFELLPTKDTSHRQTHNRGSSPHRHGLKPHRLGLLPHRRGSKPHRRGSSACCHHRHRSVIVWLWPSVPFCS
ncbi:hypothetical protein AHAS_Ahas09G0113300 [Arachis hypogaea]